MKNLLIYINPGKKFSNEGSILAKIQIENSLELGWKKEDIILVTNFNYEYHGVKAKVIGGETFFPYEPEQTKTLTVPYLIGQGIIKKGYLYWLHDFDAFQMEVFNESELKIEGKDLALADYGWKDEWNTGSLFLRAGAKDIFESLSGLAHKLKCTDEQGLAILIEKNSLNIRDRYKKLNITYDFNMLNIASNYVIADKPIKIVHFHPIEAGPEVLNSFIPIMTPRLISLFIRNGVG